MRLVVPLWLRGKKTRFLWFLSICRQMHYLTPNRLSSILYFPSPFILVKTGKSQSCVFTNYLTSTTTTYQRQHQHQHRTNININIIFTANYICQNLKPNNMVSDGNTHTYSINQTMNMFVNCSYSPLSIWFCNYPVFTGLYLSLEDME